jgi:hypothetical protein
MACEDEASCYSCWSFDCVDSDTYTTRAHNGKEQRNERDNTFRKHGVNGEAVHVLFCWGRLFSCSWR